MAGAAMLDGSLDLFHYSCSMNDVCVVNRCHMNLMPNCRKLDAWIWILCASTHGVRPVRSQACSLLSLLLFFLLLPSSFLPASSQPCLLPCKFPPSNARPLCQSFSFFLPREFRRLPPHPAPAACADLGATIILPIFNYSRLNPLCYILAPPRSAALFN